MRPTKRYTWAPGHDRDLDSDSESVRWAKAGVIRGRGCHEWGDTSPAALSRTALRRASIQLRHAATVRLGRLFGSLGAGSRPPAGSPAGSSIEADQTASMGPVTPRSTEASLRSADTAALSVQSAPPQRRQDSELDRRLDAHLKGQNPSPIRRLRRLRLDLDGTDVRRFSCELTAAIEGVGSTHEPAHEPVAEPAAEIAAEITAESPVRPDRVAALSPQRRLDAAAVSSRPGSAGSAVSTDTAFSFMSSATSASSTSSHGPCLVDLARAAASTPSRSAVAYTKTPRGWIVKEQRRPRTAAAAEVSIWVVARAQV
ncbi:uncharacterized protein V1510DRAFT_408836 [Dipodascopsis tothii]|uniref:uncharacterized protein n=1 Tax=Dipodascopsis tothii TaxID=44089 RepID=UPI0034CD9ECE